MSTLLECDHCGRKFPSETAKCTFCSGDVTAVSHDNSQDQDIETSQFPYVGIAFVLVFFAWIVMLLGSSRVSLNHTGTLEHVRLFAPYSLAQVIFHKIGFYLSLASLPLSAIELIKNRKSQLAWLTLAIALLYVTPRLCSHIAI